MVARQKLCICLSAFLFIGFLSNCSATTFMLQNSCSHPIWLATRSRNGAAILGDGRFLLASGATTSLPVPPDWSGQLWPRTGCNFNDAGDGHCMTGDCGGKLKCTGGPSLPVTLVEFDIGSGGAAKDSYGINHVNGYNVGAGVRPSGGTGDCPYTGCLTDVNEICPKGLQVVGDDGVPVGCKSACAGFNAAEYCCNRDHSTLQTCTQMDCAMMFKSACPSYHDFSSTCTCAVGSNVTVGSEIFNSTKFDEWVEMGMAPAIGPSLKLYEDVLSLGFKVILLTGRSERHRNITVENLVQAGFRKWDKLILRSSEDHGKTTTKYKSEKRNEIVEEGFQILGNSGDQWSDLLGS